MAPSEWDASALLDEEIGRLTKRLAEENKRIAQISTKLKTAENELAQLNEYYNTTLAAVQVYKNAPVVKIDAYKDTVSAIVKMENVAKNITQAIDALTGNLEDAKIFAAVLEDEIERLERERSVKCKVINFTKPDGG